MEPRLDAKERRLDQPRARLSRWAATQDGWVRHSLTCAVRVFACLLLDSAQRCTQGSISSIAVRGEMGRLLESNVEPRQCTSPEVNAESLQALPWSAIAHDFALVQCADNKPDVRQLSLAERVIERAAFYQNKLTVTSNHIAEHAIQVDRLSKEYYILRIALVRCLRHSKTPPVPRNIHL